MRSDLDSSGVVTSSAMRAQLVIAIVSLPLFAVAAVFVFAVHSPWWEEAVCPLFDITSVVALWQALTCSIEFDPSGVRARPWPWHPVSLRWQEIVAFQGRSRGVHVVTGARTAPMLLLPFGHHRPQVRARQAAVVELERARALHCR